MRAVALVARAELRTRPWALVALGLLLGLVGGVVLGSVAVADRTATAHARLAAAVGLGDAQLNLPEARRATVAAVPTLPGVVASWAPQAWVARVEGPGVDGVRYVSVSAGGDHPAGLMTPVVVAGRAPHDDAPDEVVAGEPAAAELGLVPGSEVTLALLLPEEVARFDVGFGEPDGARVTVRVVGIARAPNWDDPLTGLLAGPAFARAHGDEASGRSVFVRLAATDDAARTAFTDALVAAHAADPESSLLDGYLRPEPTFPTAVADPSVRAAQTVLVAGLAVFGVTVGLGGLLVVAQGLLRHHGAHREAQRVERALGLTLAERTLVRVLAGVPGALVAALLGAGLTLAAGVVEPLGSQAQFEPTPGFRPPWAIALLGGAGLGLLFTAMTAGAAVAAARRRRPAAATPGTGLAWLGRRPTLLAGIGLAWRGRGPGGGVRTAATTAGLAVAVAGIVAGLTFAASLHRLVTTPARYGETADVYLSDATEPDVEALVADPRVAALDVVTIAPVTAVAVPVPLHLVGVQQRLGDRPLEVLDGRTPRRAGEVALGPRTARLLRADVGDTVAVRPTDGSPSTLTVVGVVVFPIDAPDTLGEGNLVDPGQIRGLTRGALPFVDAHVLAVPGQAAALLAELGSRLEVAPAGTPPEVRNLGDLLPLPQVLALVLAAVGGAATVHVLAVAARRHGRDLAVLSVLGATPGQVRGTLAVVACATVLPAVAVGVPLGLGLARVVWWEVARAAGYGGDLDVPVGLVAVVPPLLLAGALLAVAVPAVRVARVPPASLLAGE